jgi:hypothetical protein
MDLERVTSEMRAGFAAIEARIERRLGDQARWMYVAWAAQMAAIIAFGPQ